MPAFQLLIYPVTDNSSQDTPSQRMFAQGFFLTADVMRWFRAHYFGPDEATLSLDPAASPLLADDFAGLPPAHIVVAGFDPLRDEGLAYAARLSAAGVPVTVDRAGSMIHGFFNMTMLSPDARESAKRAADEVAEDEDRARDAIRALARRAHVSARQRLDDAAEIRGAHGLAILIGTERVEDLVEHDVGAWHRLREAAGVLREAHQRPQEHAAEPRIARLEALHVRQAVDFLPVPAPHLRPRLAERQRLEPVRRVELVPELLPSAVGEPREVLHRQHAERHGRKEVVGLRLSRPVVAGRVGAVHGARRHRVEPVSYTHLRAHETVLDLVCRLLLEKKNALYITTT